MPNLRQADLHKASTLISFSRQHHLSISNKTNSPWLNRDLSTPFNSYNSKKLNQIKFQIGHIFLIQGSAFVNGGFVITKSNLVFVDFNSSCKIS